jgi:hypothetical protein
MLNDFNTLIILVCAPYAPCEHTFRERFPFLILCLPLLWELICIFCEFRCCASVYQARYGRSCLCFRHGGTSVWEFSFLVMNMWATFQERMDREGSSRDGRVGYSRAIGCVEAGCGHATF